MNTYQSAGNTVWYDDVAENLDTFTRLSKAGHFERAVQFYQRTLRRYDDDFAVAAQYADSLIDQGAFAAADNFLVEHLSQREDRKIGAASGHETTILNLLLANAQLYTKFEPGRAAGVAMNAIREIGIVTIGDAMSQFEVDLLQ